MIKYHYMNAAIAFALLLMGFTSLVAQTLAIREFLIAFYGNELTIGMILANWILLGALGSFLASRLLKSTEKAVTIYTILQAGLTLYLPISIFLIRNIKNTLGLTAGEGVGAIPILISSFLILAPIGLMIGAQFPFGANILSRAFARPMESAGIVYILEGIGFIIAGPIFTYFLITTVNSFGIVFLVGLINMISAIFLLKDELSHISGRILFGAFSFLLALEAASFFLLSPGLNTITINRQWNGQHVVRYLNSIYGNLTVSQSGKQYTFYSNGIPVITAPVPDLVSIEERVHFTMLSCNSPRKVLLVGGGAGGIITEVLKYPVEKVAYVELDPALIRLVREFPTPLTQKEFRDSRVVIYNLDGRRFFRTTKDKFDVIMINLPMPSTLQLNRFYTREFFMNARDALEDGGVFSFTLPGSLSYISPEQARLNLSILTTLDGVLRSAVIPGDNNLYLGSKIKLKIDPQDYLAKLERYGLKTTLMNMQYFEHRLDPKVQSWFYKETGRLAGVRKNTDLLPSGVFYGLWYWSTLFSKNFAQVFTMINRLSIMPLILGLGLLGTLLVAVGITHPRPEKICSTVVLGSTGFAGMSLSLLFMYAYQSFYGFIFQQIAMLVTAFMAGLTLASWLMNRSLSSIKDDCSSFIVIEAACFGFSIAMIPVLFFLNADPRPGFAWILFASSAAAGAFVGLEFPLANRLYAKGGDPVSTSGTVYAIDLAGSWLAALFVSVALVPVIGMILTCVILAAVKGLSLTLLFITSSD
jgi:spermidine synthase